MKFIEKQAKKIEGKTITLDMARYIVVLPVFLALQPVAMLMMRYAC